MKKAFLTAMTALSMVAAPTMAAAAPIATPLTQPASETVEGDSALAGGIGIFIAIFAVVAIGLGVAAGTSGDSTPDAPNSP